MRSISIRLGVSNLLPRRLLGWPIEGLWRRSGWVHRAMTGRKLMNGLGACQAYVRRSAAVPGLPVVLKIDISPLCNLRCVTCVHAGAHCHPDLATQHFDASQRMSTDRFAQIIRQTAGRTSAVSLYYLGDPIVHPDLDEMCRIARAAGVNVHISTNFSVTLPDERLRAIARSGLTHLTVCVDGLSQATYELTRVGGRIDRIMANLERLCRLRRELGLHEPQIEVQYIKFRHNVGELEEARRRFEAMGIDQFTHFWGRLHNYVDVRADSYRVHGPRPGRRRPVCGWPYVTMVVLWNGDVIPCCIYRNDAPYAVGGDARTLGNVFATSVRDVWAGPAYRAVRRLVSDPGRASSDPELARCFCHGCPKAYVTDYVRNCHGGDACDWESLYESGPNGLPRRRVPSAT